MSLRTAINQKCKDCIYDPVAPGTWLQQVTLCSALNCPLHSVRPKTRNPIPESTLNYYQVGKLASFQEIDRKLMVEIG